MKGAAVSRCVVVSGHHSGGRFTLLDIPGVYQNGVPVPVASTRLTEEELAAKLARTPYTVEFIEIADEASEPVITPEEASEAASVLSLSDEVASEAGKTLAAYEQQTKRKARTKPADSAAKEG
jgi:hypothetical protein